MYIGDYLQGVRKAKRQEKLFRQRRQRFVRLGVEPLEDRTLLSVSGVPVWTPQGPAPVLNNDGTTEGAGAIEAIATQPGNAANIYIGSVNGGIWHTTKGTSTSPSWTPQTDQAPSLSIGAITFASWDSSGNTLFAGFADTSSYNANGGPLPGDILETTNGGTNWSLVPVTGLAGNNVNNIATTTDSSGHRVVLIASDGGLYRSTNGGTSFQQVAPFNNTGKFSDVVVDTANPEVVYAASPSAEGFYESTNAGASFGAYNLSSFMSSTSLQKGVGNIKLAATESGGGGILYLDVLDPVGNFLGIFRVNINLSNGDFSATQYSQLTPADQSAPDLHHISIAANLANPLQVYVGMSESGVWLVTASTATKVFGVDGSGTHGDSRHMVFDSNGDLLQADDGGIWRLHNPGPNQTWQAMDGNLNITEVYTIDYDLTHKTVVSGAQDQGDSYQTAPSVLPQPQTEGGDGGVTYVDNTSSGGPYYYMSSGGNGLGIERFAFDNSLGPDVLTAAPVSMIVQGTNETIGQFDPVKGGFYITPWALNAVDPTRILLGITYLYESVRGESPANSNYSFNVMAKNGQPVNLGVVTTLAYGGWSGTTPMPDVAYVANNSGQLYVRSKIVNGDFTDFTLTKYTGGRITSIALDPTNWQKLYVQAASGDIWYSSNAGQTWVDISTNLPQVGRNIAFDQGAHALQVVSINGNVALLLGDLGGLFVTTNPTALNAKGTSAAVWSTFMGSNLPRTPVAAVQYYPSSDVLEVATFGRGVWTLSGASNYVFSNSAMILTHDSTTTTDTVRLVLDPYNANLLDVFQNNSTSTPNAVMPITQLTSVIIQGMNEQENLILDNSNGAVNVPGGIDYYGGSVASPGGTNQATLTVNDTNDTVADTLTENKARITWQLAGSSVSGYVDLTNVGTVDLDSSSVGDTFNAQATSSSITTNLVSEALPGSNINIGNNGSVQGIQGVLNLENLPSFNDIVVNDSNDPNIHQSVVLGNAPAAGWGTLTGLTPAAINFVYDDTTSVTVDLPNAFHFIAQTNSDIGSSLTVTPITPAGNLVYNINGNTNLLSPGNTLTVSNANGTVVDHSKGNNAGDFTFAGGTTPVVNYTGIQTPVPIGLLVAGTDAGVSPEVKVYTAQTGDLLYDLHPFKPSFQGGVRVAVGDLAGSGIPDIMTAEGAGDPGDGDSLIQVFDGTTGQQLAGPLGLFDPFPGFAGGLWVAAADLAGSGHADLIVGQGAGGQGLVNIYDGQTGNLIVQFQPYGASFTSDVRVAAGPVASNDDVEIVTAPGPGGPPLVDVFDGPNLVQGNDRPVASFDAFAPTFAGGVYVATGLISGQGHPPADIIVGEGAGGEPRLSVFDGTGNPLQSFLAFAPSFEGGVRVAAADVNGSGRSSIVAAQGPGTGSSSQVHAFHGVSLQQLDNISTFAANRQSGLFVAGGGRWGLFQEVPLPSPPPSPPPVSQPASPPPPTSARPPTLNAPPLVTFLDRLFGGIETMNGDGGVTVTDSLFGIPLLVSTFDPSGNLESVTLFGINVTILFEML